MRPTHDGGISVALDNVTANDHVCTSVAGYRQGSAFFPGAGSGTDSSHPASARALSSSQSDPAYLGHIEDMSLCKSLFGIGSISKGDVLRIHTQRNTPDGDPAGMGIMIGYLDGNSVTY